MENKTPEVIEAEDALKALIEKYPNLEITVAERKITEIGFRPKVTATQP